MASEKKSSDKTDAMRRQREEAFAARTGGGKAVEKKSDVTPRPAGKEKRRSKRG
jgi:hypothetical protein